MADTMCYVCNKFTSKDHKCVVMEVKPLTSPWVHSKAVETRLASGKRDLR